MRKSKSRRLLCLVTLMVGLAAFGSSGSSEAKKDKKITENQSYHSNDSFYFVKKNHKITKPLLKKFEIAVNTAMATYDVQGTAIAIVKGDEIVYAKGFGMRNLENQEPVTPYTQFPVGSISKAITSMMIATLVDDGLLDWNQPVVEIWPDFTMPTEELTNQVQVRHLMQMNTGLNEDSNRLFYETRTDSFSAEEQLDLLGELSVGAKLEERFHYSNQVYATSAFIGALAYGVPYGDLFNGLNLLMQERVFNAIGMQSAALSHVLPAVSNDYATGYAFNLVSNSWEPVPYYINIDSYAGAIGVSTNAMDLARFLITQLNQGIAPNGTRVVSAQNLLETQKPYMETNWAFFELTYPLAQSFHYGMGWVSVEQSNGVQMIAHSGAGEGFISDMAFIPEADVGIVILNNLNFFHGVLDGYYFIGVVRESLFELLYGLEPKVAEERAKQYQQAVKEATIPRETMQVTFNADTVAPLLGNYEKGWRVELQDDNTLWVRLLEVYESQLVLLPDGTYRLSNNTYSGKPVSFSKNDEGNVMMTITTIGTDTVAKID